MVPKSAKQVVSAKFLKLKSYLGIGFNFLISRKRMANEPGGLEHVSLHSTPLSFCQRQQQQQNFQPTYSTRQQQQQIAAALFAGNPLLAQHQQRSSMLASLAHRIGHQAMVSADFLKAASDVALNGSDQYLRQLLLSTISLNSQQPPQQVALRDVRQQRTDLKSEHDDSYNLLSPRERRHSTQQKDLGTKNDSNTLGAKIESHSPESTMSSVRATEISSLNNPLGSLQMQQQQQQQQQHPQTASVLPFPLIGIEALLSGSTNSELAQRAILMNQFLEAAASQQKPASISVPTVVSVVSTSPSAAYHSTSPEK